MAAGCSSPEDITDTLEWILSKEAGQQLNYQGQVILGEPESSWMNINSDGLPTFEDSFHPPDIGENQVMSDQLMDQNTVYSSMPCVTALSSVKPFVQIIEQPARQSLKFRYKCEIEKRSAGSIMGAKSTPEHKTHPAIKVMNYQGPYVVVVSCVTKDGPPYWPHPHNLVGREFCKKGICTIVVDNPDMTCRFTTLGIQCVKKSEFKKYLKIRQDHKLDPFKTGFNYPGNIDLSVLRLCFQVYIRHPDTLYCSVPLPPVVSEPIYDKKAISGLTIMKLSHCSGPVSGDLEIIILCDRVAKEDIEIWFYEEEGTRIVWEGQAEFQPSDVHKHFAISFRTPPYYNQNIQEIAPVLLQLRRPSDNSKGEPRKFDFLPLKRDPDKIAHKKRKFIGKRIEEYLGSNIIPPKDHQISICVPRTRKHTIHQRIKAQPRIGPNSIDGHFEQPSTSFAKYSNSTISTIMPVSIGGPSTSPHVTPSHSTALTLSPGAHGHVSPPLTALLSPIMQQMVQQNESPEPNSMNETHGTNEDTLIEKLNCLDRDLNLYLTQNLSASLFDSF